MCGIVGLMSLNKIGFATAEVTMFEQMIYADQLRGHHGTGMFYDTRDKGVGYIRGAMTASEFLNDAGVKKALQQVFTSASFVVGHNRWATKGAHTTENTHPFSEAHITLVHNGTLYSHRKLKNVDVDSHAVCHAFAERDETEVLKEIDGAFAFVWYNEATSKLHFVRNGQRPLHIIRTKDIIAIASEPKMAEWIIARNNGEVLSVEPVEIGMMYSFDRDKRTLTSEKVEFLPVKEKSTTTSHFSPNYGSSAATGYWRGQVWIPFSPRREEEDTTLGVSNVRYLPPAVVPKQAPFKVPAHAYEDAPVSIGDRLDFTPLSIDPKGNGYQLTLIKQGPIGSPDVYAIYYHKDRVDLEKILTMDCVEARVVQVRRKNGVESYIVNNLTQVFREEPVVPKSAVASAAAARFEDDVSSHDDWYLTHAGNLNGVLN